jgi:hypothetical protein
VLFFFSAAQSSAPSYSGSASLSKQASISSSSSATVPIYHSSCDVTKQTQIAVSATANVPVYSGNSSVSKQGVLSSSGTNSVPIYSASCSITRSASIQTSGSATAPTYNSSSSLSKSSVFSGSSTFAVPNYSATASISKNTALVGTGSASVPIYHLNADTSKKAQISSAATNIQPGFSTTCFVNKSTQFTALATLVAPNYSGLSSVSKKALENSSGRVTGPTYNASVFLLKSAACSSLSSTALSSPGSLTSSEIVKRENSLDRGRLAWWVALSGSEGGRFFYDIIGSSHGVLTNMTSPGSGWASTVRSNGMGQINFDGSNDLIRAPAVVTKPPFTIACWFYSSDYADFRTLVDIGAAGQTNSHIRLMTTLLGTVRLNTIDSVGSQGVLDTLVSGVPGRWYCAVATIPESDPALLYLNGNAAPSNLVASSYNLFDSTTFGALPWSSNIQFHMGAIDSISVWNRILSPDEILEHYRERDYREIREDFNLSSQAVTQNYSATASLNKQSQFSGSATFAAPVYHAGASLTKSPQISSAFSPQYHAACALTVSHIENSSANFSIVAKDAAALLSKHPTMYGVGSLTTPPHAAISVSKKATCRGHAVNSNPNPGQPFYYVKRKHYIKKTFFR